MLNLDDFLIISFLENRCVFVSNEMELAIPRSEKRPVSKDTSSHR